MKNEVNRTFTVKKNKFTNFLNCFYANTPQNTGGGNSHSSTVVTPVWKGSRPTVSRRSTDSQSQDHRNHTPISKALKYAAMIFMLLSLGIGQMWGDETFTFSWTSAGTAGYSYSQAGPTGGELITNNAIYFLSNEGPKVDASKLNPYRVGFVFKPTTNVTLKIKCSAGSSARTIQSIKIDEEIDARFYSLCKDAVGASKTVMKYALDNASDEDKAFYATVGILKVSKGVYSVAGDAKSASGQTAQASLYDARQNANNISVPANGNNEVILNTGSPAEDYEFQAGKCYRVYTEVSSSTGSQVVSFTFASSGGGGGTPTHTLTWNLDGGTATGGTAAGAVAEGATLTAPTVTKDGYDFAGWSPNVPSTMPSDDATYTANWTKVYASGTYQFDGNATLGTNPSKTVTTSNTDYSAFRIDNLFFSTTKIAFEGTDGTPSGDGSDYNGWKVKYNGTTNIKFFVENNSDVEVSIGSIGSSCNAKISYTDHGGTAHNNTAISAGSHPSYEVKAGTMVTLALTANGSNSVTLKRIKITSAAPATTYTVTYQAGEGTGTDVVVDDATTVAGCPNTFTAPNGKSFVGWKNASTSADVAVGATVTATMTLVAQWATLYSVTYVMNGPSDEAPTQASVVAGTEITLAAAQTWTDHTFLGWLCDIDSEVKTAETSYTMTAAATTFTAQWKVNAPVITFNNATGAVSITAAEGATIKYSLDGSDPTSGTTYSESFVIDDDKTVQAVAIQSDHTTSDVASKSCVLCHEPATLTNEIARFFVPCGTTSGSYNVTNEESSIGANTFSTTGFGSSWDTKANGWAYGKLNDDSYYIEIKLKSGNFEVGDVVYGYFSTNNNGNNLKLHSTSGNALGDASASGLVDGEYVRSHALVAADIEEGGSIKFFRADSKIRVNRIVITREPPCVGDPGDISKGTLSAGVLTLNAAGSPLSGDTWYWQTSATGTDQTNSGTSYGVSAAGTYYVRSYNATGTCWSDAKSFTVTAEDLVESFTVVFKDGETTLGSETVEVGEHPTAAGITTTKEFYTFAAWQESGVDKALNTVSAANGETVILTARYTGNYAYGTYLFNSLTMGSTISKTITDKEVVYNDAFRVDNFYFAAGIKIQGEIGTAEETTTLTNYMGWKLKTNAKTIKFLVENNSQVKVAIGEKTGIQVTYTPLVGAETTASQAKDNETAYSVKGGTVVTITTTSDNTTTLKRLSISNLYNVTYTDGTGDASGSASNVPEVTLPTPKETIVTVESTDYSFTGWKANQAVTVNDVVKSAGTLLNAGDVAVLGANTTFTAQWAVATPKYAITKGTHTNGDFTISVAEQEAGGAVTLTATPNEDYVFSAWAVVKTEDGSATGITVSNNTFTMPAYGVTVNATFAADPRSKVLYVTSNSESDTKASDKVYAALKDTYNVKIVGPSSDADQSGYALVVLHESVTGSNYSATAVAAAKTGTTPVLNTKAYFYNSGRWEWGTPNAGKKTKGVHVNRTYCNITNHPLFNELTPDANDSIIILSAINGDNKPIQPIGSFTSGKEGYTLANVPDGCAIHELTPAQRGAESGKYLLISLYTKDFANLNANGQKLFQNAAAYLIGNTAWEPVNALSSPAVTASPSAAYSVGDNIALTASATGSSAATTYTWYKGDTWAAAEEAGAIKDAATAAAGGNTYGITGCALDDAGTYWCVISNGTGCEVSASLAVTVSDVSYDIAFVSAHGTAPTATTGVSYTLPELTASGWEHQGWTANINVTVDAATVDAGDLIANGKIATFGANVTFTAVWKQVFDVTFNMQSHGASISAQHIVNGGKATEPNEPSAIGWVFGGWFTDAECTEGNEFDFNTAISDDTELFAKWTAFTGCTELWPATSGDALIVGAMVDLQAGSVGGSIKVANLGAEGSIAYNANGLSFSNGGKDSVLVTLNNDLKNGSIIKVRLMANGDTKNNGRGLNLYNAAREKKALLGWQANEEVTSGDVREFTYTVVESDGFAGTNVFTLQRQNSVFLQSIKVEECGDAIVYHNLTSEVNIAGKGTVTLGATSVREGRTTTATYSDIDPLYEFVSWSVSGEGASIEDASANPATITMGTEDAVVTLNLQLIPVRYTVTYMDGESTLGTEDVDENGHPTASEIATAKEGYIFEGWYNDAELISGPVTLSSVTITAAKTFYGKWVSDGKIRLIANGALNTTDFVTGGTLQDDASYTVEGTTYAKNVQLGGMCNTVGDINNYNKVIMYNTQTDATNIKIALYDPYSNSTTHHAYIVIRQEGNDTPLKDEDVSINTGAKRDVVKEYNITGRATVYVMVSNTNVRVCQIEVTESGSANAVAPAVGYSVNLNKGRMVIPVKDTEVRFEGISYNVAEAYQPARTDLKIKTNNTHYVSFTIPSGEARQLQLTTSSTSKYAVSQTKGDVTTLITPVANKAQTFNLGEGTWYINPNGSNVSITSIAFDAPQYDLNDDTNVSAILPGADVTVNNGVSLNVDVEKTIHDLTISSKAGASGQITGTVTNLTIAGDLYMDVRFFEGAETLDETTAGRWYMISAPFDVNLSDGFINPVSGETMTFGQTDGENIFDLFEYDGSKRASTGVTGWKRVQGKMKAGRACLIGFNPDQPTTIRLKAASTVLSEPTSITLNAYAGDATNQNWNGVANPTLHYTDLSHDVQTYNNEDGENGRKYNVYAASDYSFVVGTAFFVQATGSINLTAATHDAFRAPQRQANERYEACVRIFRQEATDFADQMYVRASENASNEYEQGHDMITWNGTTANTALIWAENYGKRLAIEEAPMVNDKATYNLGIFAPVAGEYRIEAANPNDDATLYLTKNGRIFWNLTMGACELDLAQGQNNEYGLLLRAEAPAVTTGMDEIRSEAGVQKIIIDENVFILRGEQLFDMTGKAVK